MVMLSEASITHSIPAAIHSVGELGMTNSARLARIAPIRKNGRRRPNWPPMRTQVLSERWPMIGWTISPVIGAAIHRIASSSTSAPSVWKIRLTLPFWRSKPIWMPRKPKLMFQICAGDRAGLAAPAVCVVTSVLSPRAASRGVTRPCAGTIIPAACGGLFEPAFAASLDALQKYARTFR